MAIWKEDVTGFDYRKDGYAIYDKLTIGDIKNARINTKHQRAIAISFMHGNTLSECTKSLKTCYDVAVKARSLYAGAYHQTFPVSAKAMAWEIWLHAVPEALDTLIKNKLVRVILGTTVAGQIAKAAITIAGKHTDYVDSGITDNVREHDAKFEKAYDLIYG